MRNRIPVQCHVDRTLKNYCSKPTITKNKKEWNTVYVVKGESGHTDIAYLIQNRSNEQLRLFHDWIDPSYNSQVSCP